MSEMTALEYFKAKARMTNNCSIDCRNCTLFSNVNGQNMTCGRLEHINPEKLIEIVEKWAKENPVKTYKDVLLEKFPKAKLNRIGNPLICLKRIDSTYQCEWDSHADCDEECWNQEYKED